MRSINHLPLSGVLILICLAGCTAPDQDIQPQPETASIPLPSGYLRTEYQESFPKYIKRTTDFSGLCVDIIHALEQESGLQILIQNDTFTPFKRLQKHLEQNKIDIFVGFKKSPDREQRYDFIEPPIYMLRSVVAVRSDEALNIRSIEDLYGRTVMVPHGSATAQKLKQEHPQIEVDEGGDIFTCLKKLVKQRHDVVFYHNLGIIGAINEMNLQDSVKILPYSFDEYVHHIAVSKQLPSETKDILQNAVARLAADGRLTDISSRYDRY